MVSCVRMCFVGGSDWCRRGRSAGVFGLFASRSASSDVGDEGGGWCANPGRFWFGGSNVWGAGLEGDARRARGCGICRVCGGGRVRQGAAWRARGRPGQGRRVRSCVVSGSARGKDGGHGYPNGCVLRLVRLVARGVSVCALVVVVVGCQSAGYAGQARGVGGVCFGVATSAAGGYNWSVAIVWTSRVVGYSSRASLLVASVLRRRIGRCRRRDHGCLGGGWGARSQRG